MDTVATLDIQWIDKTEAGTRLGIAPKSVLAMAQRGALTSKDEYDPMIKQTVKLFHVGDIERILWDRTHPSATPATPKKSATPEPLALPAPDEPDEELEFELPKNENPWLTLDEAARYTRLPKAYLRKLATVGELATRNVGIKEVRVRVSRRALDQL